MASHTSINQTDQEQTVNDLGLLLNTLTSVAPKSTDLGLNLGVSIEKINIIKANNPLQCVDQLRAILEERLNQEEPLRWWDVVTALRAESVGEHRVARRIESQYIIPSSQLVPSMPYQESTIVTHSATTTPTLSPSSSSQLHTSLAECLHHSGSSFAYQQQPMYQPPLPHYLSFTQPPDVAHAPSQIPSYHHHSPHPLPCYPPSYQYPSVPNLTSGPHTQMQATMRPAKHPHLLPQPALSAKACPESHMLAATMLPDHLPPVVAHSIQHQPTTVMMPQFRQFINYVSTVYRSSEVQSDTHVVKWPPTPSKVYINLVCINRKVRGLRGKYDEVTEAMVRDGNLDVILGEKWPIDMSEIVRDLPEGKGLLLIEGAPGVGKSTFAWEFCRRWVKGEIAGQYQLVLLLRLRDESISKAKTLKDLIYHPSADVCQAVVTHLQYTLGANVLIILEGFDELPEAGRSEQSVFHELIRGQLLPLATVMVTSRPWAASVVHERFSRRIVKHVEILGFNNKQIRSYIQSVSSEEDVEGLEAYLKKHPQIRMCMYIPLNSAIVVTVYQESQDSGYKLPTILTELYTSLAKILLIRHLRGHPEYEIGSKCLNLFNDLLVPDAVYDNFIKLCELAYTGVTHRQVQLIFRDSDIPSNFDNLGFMDSVTELYASQGTVSSHNFLHLTFQELFAAVHISTLSPAKQLEHFSMYMHRGEFIVVLRFLAGLNKFKFFSTRDLVRIFNKPSAISSYDLRLDSYHVQWLFEAQNVDLITLVLGQNKRVHFNSRFYTRKMLPMDYYSLGYCIGHSQCQWVLSLDEEIGVEEIEMLLAGKTGGDSGRVVGLGGKNYSKSAEALNFFFTEFKHVLNLHQLHLQLPVPCDQITWPDLSALQEIKLDINGITKWRLDKLLLNLSLKFFSINARTGSFSSTGISFEDCMAIGTSVINLKELVIGEPSSNVLLEIEDAGMEVITGALTSNKLLEQLKFSCMSTFTNTAADYLAQFITKCSTLKYLVISKCTFKPHGILLVAKSIRSNPNLYNSTTLYRSISMCLSLVIHGDNEMKDLAEILHYSDMLTLKNLAITGISDVGSKTLSQTLNDYKPLHALMISNCSINKAGENSLAHVIAHNYSLIHVQLTHNSITDDGAVGLSQILCHNSTIVSLDLSYNNISDVGAVALADALLQNFTLKELNLSGNHDIGEKGSHQLVEALIFSDCKWNSVKTNFNLVLPSNCETYAKQCSQFPEIKKRIKFL